MGTANARMEQVSGFDRTQLSRVDFVSNARRILRARDYGRGGIGLTPRHSLRRWRRPRNAAQGGRSYFFPDDGCAISCGKLFISTWREREEVFFASPVVFSTRVHFST